MRSGDLGPVLVFTACALITLGTLLLRRHVFVYTTPSGEKIPASSRSKTLAYATAGVMTLLWVIYVARIALDVRTHQRLNMIEEIRRAAVRRGPGFGGRGRRWAVGRGRGKARTAFWSRVINVRRP